MSVVEAVLRFKSQMEMSVGTRNPVACITVDKPTWFALFSELSQKTPYTSPPVTTDREFQMYGIIVRMEE